MGYIWAIYYLYLRTYLLLPFPVGYPSYYPTGTRVINYPDTAALHTIDEKVHNADCAEPYS